MEKGYNYEKKKRLAEKISRIKKKKDLIKIFEIIYEENKQISENNNGIFMFFHNLSEKAYQNVEQYLKNMKKRRTEARTESDLSEKTNTVCSPKDDMTELENLSPKLRYSNREKNIIKRLRYDETISSNNENSDKEIYKQFQP